MIEIEINNGGRKVKNIIQKLKLHKKTSNLRKVFKGTQSNSGFSLIEILIALTILGLAGTIVVGKIFTQLEEGKISAARIQITNLSNNLMEYRRHCGSYPTTDQGLDALLEKPTSGKPCNRYQEGGYLEGTKIPLDPWDNEYVYTSDGKTFEIISYGSSGVESEDGESSTKISSKDAK